MTAVANHVPLSPLTFLARARRAFGPETAVIDTDGTTVTYHELGRDCDALAGALRADAVQAATGSPCWISTPAGCSPRTTACLGHGRRWWLCRPETRSCR